MKRWEPEVGDRVIVYNRRKYPNFRGTIVERFEPETNVFSYPRFRVRSDDFEESEVMREFRPFILSKFQMRPAPETVLRLMA